MCNHSLMYFYWSQNNIRPRSIYFTIIVIIPSNYLMMISTLIGLCYFEILPHNIYTLFVVLLNQIRLLQTKVEFWRLYLLQYFNIRCCNKQRYTMWWVNLRWWKLCTFFCFPDDDCGSPSYLLYNAYTYIRMYHDKD